MRTLILLLFVIQFISCGDKVKTKSSETTDETDSSSIKKADLSRIQWIVGNWKGMYEGKPFYEDYHFINDSSIEITSYELSGNDTSKTSLSYVFWKEGHYYLGDSLNWKVNTLTDREIYMEPNYRATNDIRWTFQDSSTWIAVLKTPGTTHTYIMERQAPLDSLLKEKKK